MLEIVDVEGQKRIADKVVEVNGMKVTLRGYYMLDYKQYANGYKKYFDSATRIYVSIKNESILENLENRRHRPYNEYRKIVQAVMAEVGLSGTLSWSQRAGCTFCPCSPGFILKSESPKTTDFALNWHFSVIVEKSESLSNNGFITPLSAYALL